MIQVLKKNGELEPFTPQKIKDAVQKSAYRAVVKLSDKELDYIATLVKEAIERSDEENVTVADIHNRVEIALEQVNHDVAREYKDYRNYKKELLKEQEELQEKILEVRHGASVSSAP